MAVAYDPEFLPITLVDNNNKLVKTLYTIDLTEILGRLYDYLRHLLHMFVLYAPRSIHLYTARV